MERYRDGETTLSQIDACRGKYCWRHARQQKTRRQRIDGGDDTGAVMVPSLSRRAYIACYIRASL